MLKFYFYENWTYRRSFFSLVCFVFVYVFSFKIVILSIITKFVFQEQYKTIFLVLHEICKAQINPKTPTDFLKCLETGAQDKPVNSSALRKEFQVRIVFNVFSIWYILIYFSLLIISLYWKRLVIGTLGTSKKLFIIVYKNLFIWSFCCSMQCITTSA